MPHHSPVAAQQGFLDKYCQDDGDLFLLILHELYHVILGHTRLFPRVTPIDNIVFDAVINSMLSRTVGRTVGTRLFTRTNGYDSLPERLLRPPPGWPDEFEGALAALPYEEQRIIGLLYGPDEPSEITYRDIYELLRQELSGCEVPNVLLLGSHGPEQDADGLLKEAVRRIVEGWPPPPFRIAGRDQGRNAEDFWLRPADKPGSAFQKAFESVLRKCGLRAGPRRSRLPAAGDQQPAKRGNGAAKPARSADSTRYARSLARLRFSTEASYRSKDRGQCGCRSFTSISISADR